MDPIGWNPAKHGQTGKPHLRELESIQLAAVIWAVAAAGLDGPILKPFP